MSVCADANCDEPATGFLKVGRMEWHFYCNYHRAEARGFYLEEGEDAL